VGFFRPRPFWRQVLLKAILEPAEPDGLPLGIGNRKFQSGGPGATERNAGRNYIYYIYIEYIYIFFVYNGILWRYRISIYIYIDYTYYILLELNKVFLFGSYDGNIIGYLANLICFYKKCTQTSWSSQSWVSHAFQGYVGIPSVRCMTAFWIINHHKPYRRFPKIRVPLNHPF
jgi:hypothetical protein